MLYDSITTIKGFGPKKAEGFRRLGIEKISDVLSLFPRSYEDFRNVRDICSLADGEKALVSAKVLLVMPGKGFGRKRTLKLLVEDSTGRMEVLFFMAGFLMKTFKQGDEYRFFGKVKLENGRVTMFHPTYSPLDADAQSGILPVYPLTKGIGQKDVRKLSKEALRIASDEGFDETLPESIVSGANLCDNLFAISQIHFPDGEEAFKQARYRLVYEELFDLKTALLLSKNRFGKGRAGNVIKSGKSLEFLSTLPYKLTGAQSKALSDILKDMNSEYAMNRLIQGDVGSGKTAVAEAALAEAVGAGFQGAFMAPTEILATQHFETLKHDLEPLDIRILLLVGSISAKEKKAALFDIASGNVDIIVGTHALISKRVEYARLGLVVTDEQHRFGVNQRKSLSEKGENPDVLVMTATPIPRTLAVVLYGDLDISIIDELPPGRKVVETKSFDEDDRRKAYKLLVSEAKAGRQGYVVCPFIEDSEALGGYSVEGLFAEFSGLYPEVSCDILHGAMDESEKDEVMKRFAAGEISVLISTVVIEVGINVPNATVMLIENCERFGLAQLHQLRGRVGRGKAQSYCLLVVGEDSELARERASLMCRVSDGFKIADKDLEMRGPGEIFGYRQHGLPQLVLADPVKHFSVAEKAGADAESLLNLDPCLSAPENGCLLKKIRESYLENDSLVL